MHYLIRLGLVTSPVGVQVGSGADVGLARHLCGISECWETVSCQFGSQHEKFAEGAEMAVHPNGAGAARAQ